MNKKGITKEQFRNVITLLKEGNKPDNVAKFIKLSPTTVRAIKQARTWAEWERRKTAKVTRQTAQHKAVKTLEKRTAGKSARPELVKTADQWSTELFHAYQDFERRERILLKRIDEAHGLAKDAHKKLNPLLVEHNKQLVFDSLQATKSRLQRVIASWRGY